MSRVRVGSLVLVNWKGVFYERYQFDRHVTVLEGDNGAGKTTVMVAAYLVLLPDMTRLRFTNLGESGATGGDKGVWGRLGEQGRPSFAALEFRLPNGESVIAGVQLVRKAEPAVEPTPWVITGIEGKVRLQDILLLRRGSEQHVPELAELRENVARHGGKLKTCSSAREYFGALFDQGITPLRLDGDEDRTKLNEMLKTSMTGGMSRGLLGDLRNFLLREEAGLGDTLQRMRSNLEACGRTRTEVREAQALEREIQGVFEAGEAMFAAGVAATRRRADEYTRRVKEAETDHLEARAKVAQLSGMCQKARDAAAAASGTKDRLSDEVRQAAELLERFERAIHWARELSDRTGSLQERRAALEATTAQRDEARARLEEAQANREQRVGDLHRASEGLGDLEKGLEELHRKAAGYKRARRSKAEAERLLGLGELDPDSLGTVRHEARLRLVAADEERRGVVRDIEDSGVHVREHADALAALQTIWDRPVPVEFAFSVGQQALTRVRGWREVAGRRRLLEIELERENREAQRQAKALAKARALGVSWEPGSGQQAVVALLESLEGEAARYDDRRREAEDKSREADHRLEAIRARIDELRIRAVRYRSAAGLAAEVEQASGIPVADCAGLSRARGALNERLAAARGTLAGLRERAEELTDRAREMMSSGGSFPAELLGLRDELMADLVAARFEDTPLEEAAELEALLGPLAQALVVEDLEAATQRLAGRPPSLPTVWLVRADTDLTSPSALGADRRSDGDVVVDERQGRRVTRIPECPTLGRKARERRAHELREEAARLESEVQVVRRQQADLEGIGTSADELLALSATWFAGDPAEDLSEAEAQQRNWLAAREEGRAAAEQAREALGGVRPRQAAIRELLPETALLDAPDKSARIAELGAEVAAAVRAQQDLARVGTAPDALERLLVALRRIPWTDRELEVARRRREQVTAACDALRDGLENLEYLIGNREALRWSGVEAELEQKAGLLPSLQRQLDAAREALARAQREEKAIQKRFDDASTALNQADAAHVMAGKFHQEAATRLDECRIEDPTEQGLEIARSTLRDRQADLTSIQTSLEGLQREVGRQEALLETATSHAKKAAETEEDERRQARPAIESWDRLRPQVEAARLNTAALEERLGLLREGQSGLALFGVAASKKDVLSDRLRSAQGGAEVVAAMQRYLQDDEQASGEGYLKAWLTVREWLCSRLPAQIAGADDPGRALQRFQERDLRGASEDVARGIDVLVRRAQTRVRKLSEHLESVRFGSIRRIRVRMDRVERMSQVLTALRSGEAQELLFQPEMPIEEAMEEIFRRYGGGRGGGAKLLDYREYLHLQVQIQREEGADWEEANPARLSTGEAIGVGAALMMVVLTEWEHDANLLRGRRAHGSMRFLFLDEANRLDRANLATVFDLCRTLDLQLLVAAPEVARGEGCTVYRLARNQGEGGRDEVLVSGRRVVGGEKAEA